MRNLTRRKQRTFRSSWWNETF